MLDQELTERAKEYRIMAGIHRDTPGRMTPCEAVDDWLAAHIGRLAVRVEDLERRLRRVERRKG